MAGGVTSSQERTLIQQFVVLTNSSASSASKYLNKNGWRLESSVDAYFSDKSRRGGSSSSHSHGGMVSSNSGYGTSNQTMTKNLEAIFQRFKEPNEDYIGLEGTEQFFEAIGVDLEDVIALAIACVLNSPSVGQFPKQPFIDGWKGQQCDSIEKMKAKVGDLRKAYENDPAFFKRVYLFVFPFVRQENKRALDQETAIEYWSLLLDQPRFPLIDEWLAYLNERNQSEGQKRPVQKDTWNMLLEFADYVRTDPHLDHYDTDGAFPSIIDDFVSHMKKAKANGMMVD